MKLHTQTSNSILTQDLFELLGLTKLPEQEKDKFLDTINSLSLQYFFQEKIGDKLNEQQQEEVMTKYSGSDDKTIQAMLEYIVELIPEAAELYLDAVKETKARFIKDEFEDQKTKLQQKLDEEQDEIKRSAIAKMITNLDKKLAFIKANKWELITA
jgi:translation elongation factor EF-G